MTTFAVLVYVAGATLGLLVRLPVLAILVFGLVLAAIVAAVASALGVDDGLPTVLQLLMAAVLIQLGYGTTIFLRGWITRCRRRRGNDDAPPDEIDRGRTTGSRTMFEGPSERVHQD